MGMGGAGFYESNDKSALTIIGVQVLAELGKKGEIFLILVKSVKSISIFR